MIKRLCAYGNCRNDDVTVTVNHRQGLERPAFCCEEHAALWLIRKSKNYAALVQTIAPMLGEPS